MNNPGVHVAQKRKTSKWKMEKRKPASWRKGKNSISWRRSQSFGIASSRNILFILAALFCEGILPYIRSEWNPAKVHGIILPFAGSFFWKTGFYAYGNGSDRPASGTGCHIDQPKVDIQPERGAGKTHMLLSIWKSGRPGVPQGAPKLRKGEEYVYDY